MTFALLLFCSTTHGQIGKWLQEAASRAAQRASAQQTEHGDVDVDIKRELREIMDSPVHEQLLAARKGNFAAWKRAAEDGQPEGQVLLGECYFHGVVVPEDYTEAVKGYRKAAEQGNADAHAMLGICYSHGLGVPEDKAEAVRLFRQAEEQGNANAQVLLGMCYLEGLGVRENKTEAVKWFRKAEEQGNANAQVMLGMCYLNGQGVPENPAEAVKLYRQAAEQGSREAQCILGVCYMRGLGVPEDLKEAVKWWRKAAEQGNAEAQSMLGDSYYHGNGVPENKREAVKWYRLAAEQGDADAQYSLGDCYFGGDGVPEDQAEAIKWFHLAAEKEHVKAQFVLAACYDHGWGVPENKAEAIKWHSQAAEHGHVDAQWALANHYFSTGNQEEAAKWLIKAAEQGYDLAQNALGLSYLNGWGVPENKAEAIKWFRLAAEQGNPRAKEELEQLENEKADYPFVEIQLGDGENHVQVTGFSPDSRFVVTTDGIGQAGVEIVSTIWEAATGKKIREIPGENVTFSPDGRYIVTHFLSWEGRKHEARIRQMEARRLVPRGQVGYVLSWIKVFDARTGRELYEWELGDGPFALSADGSGVMFDGYLSSFANGRRVRRLTADEQKKLDTLWEGEPDPDAQSGKHPSPDGKMVCVENEKRLLIEDKESGKLLFTLENAVAPLWSPDSRFLLHHLPEKGSDEASGTVRIYDLRPEK